MERNAVDSAYSQREQPRSCQSQQTIADEEVVLDDAGEVQIDKPARAALIDQIRADLRRNWPAAGDREITEATAEVFEFRVHTVETGRMSFADAQRLSEHLADLLQPVS